MITQYDQRQLNRMKDQISSFESGGIGLGSLIGDLEFLLNAMESSDEDWKKQLDEQILILEEVYADALDRDMTELEPESQTLVSKAIETIKGYIPSSDVAG